MATRKLKTCYLPGTWNPPTEKDLQLAYWLAKKTEEVNDVVIVIPSEDDAIIPAEIKQKIWDIYLNDTGGRGTVKTIVTDDKSARHYVYKTQERMPEEAFLIAVDKDKAKDPKFLRKFDTFPNYEIIILPKYEDEYRDKMVQSVENNDFKGFLDYIPPQLHKESKKKIFELLREHIRQKEEPIIDKEHLKELYTKFNVI